MEQHSSDNVQRAAEFFRQTAWACLLDRLYEKYMALGRIGGLVVLHDASLEERREIASFLKKRMVAQGDVTIRLADFQQALTSSAFACALPELLRALYPDRPTQPRPELREAQGRTHERFLAALLALGEDLPANSRGQRWLQAGRHGVTTIFTRNKNVSEQEQKRLLEDVRLVADALNELPAPHSFERLAHFAQRISGDPHYFDVGTAGGRLFFYALSDLAELENSAGTEQEARRDADDALDSQTGKGQSAAVERQRLLVYYDAGLLLDTVSSTVAVYNLAGAEDSTDERDALIEAAGGRIVVLPLRQLLTWRKVWALANKIYVFENPQVFEMAVDRMMDLTREKEDESEGPQWPTLVCTAGWPSTAAIRLLTLLVETSEQAQLYYSGDFDGQGLRIAAHLLARYPERCRLWRFEPEAYAAALHSRSAALSEQEMAGLRGLPEAFALLVSAMSEQGKKGYQEGIAHILIEDILTERC